MADIEDITEDYEGLHKFGLSHTWKHGDLAIEIGWQFNERRQMSGGYYEEGEYTLEIDGEWTEVPSNSFVLGWRNDGEENHALLVSLSKTAYREIEGGELTELVARLNEMAEAGVIEQGEHTSPLRSDPRYDLECPSDRAVTIIIPNAAAAAEIMELVGF